MIFVTVGQMHPFDRLVRAVDEWARDADRRDVFMQVGVGGHRPAHAESVELLTPDEFRSRIAGASLVVSHAGMGTILSVMQVGTPLLVMPRLAEHYETRNDHQIASARMFHTRGGIAVASNPEQLRLHLNNIGSIAPTTRIGSRASDTLLTSIRSFIDGEPPEVVINRARHAQRNAA